tara:strand:- start:348 stop:539 length:192 start_codon:yes stop_codon:yes gene_type:complete
MNNMNWKNYIKKENEYEDSEEYLVDEISALLLSLKPDVTFSKDALVKLLMKLEEAKDIYDHTP